ncbi:MAG: NYN domain-containing protein [Planctomycetota bacterium]|jgi:hypothetical protein
MVLIDTFNVLRVTGVLPPHLAGLDVVGLVSLIGSSRWRDRQTMLICDGTGGGLVSSRTLMTPVSELPHIVALFVGPGHDADTALERRLETDSNPRRILVVSSDNRLRAAARRRRAEWMSSEAFLEALVHDQARARPSGGRSEHNRELEDEEIRAWMRAFGFDDALAGGAAVDEGQSDPLDRRVMEEWPGRVHPDDLDMQRWLDDMNREEPPGSRS